MFRELIRYDCVLQYFQKVLKSYFLYRYVWFIRHTVGVEELMSYIFVWYMYINVGCREWYIRVGSSGCEPKCHDGLLLFLQTNTFSGQRSWAPASSSACSGQVSETLRRFWSMKLTRVQKECCTRKRTLEDESISLVGLGICQKDMTRYQFLIHIKSYHITNLLQLRSELWQFWRETFANWGLPFPHR